MQINADLTNIVYNYIKFNTGEKYEKDTTCHGFIEHQHFCR